MENLRTRINGFTAWVNLRLAPSGVLSNNILEDILKGKNMKILLESMTGRPFKRLQSFDGLTQQQKVTRVEWMLKELQDRDIVQPTVKIDTQMFAMRSSTQVFELLWCLVCHDIWYVWDKSFFLQQASDKEMVSEPFTWVPGSSRRRDVHSSLSSKSESSAKSEKAARRSRDGARKRSPNYPEPDTCILDMINAHLKMNREGRSLSRGVMSLDDLTDSRVLCALINSFVPETFTTEVLLNDRWTINLAVQTANEFFKSSSPFDATDLCQGDIMSVCSYFAFFFMCGYKMKQCRAVLKRMDELMLSKVGTKHELEKLGKNQENRAELESQISEYEKEMSDLQQDYDVNHCTTWMKDIRNIQKKVRTIVAKRMKNKFDIIRVPRNMTINDLTVSLLINLSLTSGVGFYHIKYRESISKERKIIIQNTETEEFLDDLQPSSKVSVRKLLGLKEDEMVELNPDTFPQYKIFVGSASRNKILKAGTLFLYQIFPGNTLLGQRLLFKAAKAAELETVQKLISFFQSDPNFVNSAEHGSGNTALHMTSRHGHFEVVEYLLERGADVNATNKAGCSPFFTAVGCKRREIAEGSSFIVLEGQAILNKLYLNAQRGMRNVLLTELLIEWGADIGKKNEAGKTALDIIKNEEFKESFILKQKAMSQLVSRVISGDIQALGDVIQAHCRKENVLRSLRSRCIRGSTLLHTAALFGETSLVKTLLQERVPVNLLDYKGATALHRVKDVPTLQVLLEAGGNLDIVDDDGNSPLHVICYGVQGEPSNLECIEIQLKERPSLTIRNKKGMLPVHCAAIQSRHDAIELLLRFDTQQLIAKDLSAEKQVAPSPMYLAVANDHLDCAGWLAQHDFKYVRDEADELLEKILLLEIPCFDYLAATQFLLAHGASVNCSYAEGNSALHYAAANDDMSDVLKLLIQSNAKLDAVNDELFSPLFFATQNCCLYNASILISSGANVKVRNFQGLTAFDFVTDFDEWITSGYFDEETEARLKAYSLKHSRDLVRAITKKVAAMNTSENRHDRKDNTTELALAVLPPEITFR